MLLKLNEMSLMQEYEQGALDLLSTVCAHIGDCSCAIYE